jgi:hypothetical protein
VRARVAVRTEMLVPPQSALLRSRMRQKMFSESPGMRCTSADVNAALAPLRRMKSIAFSSGCAPQQHSEHNPPVLIRLLVPELQSRTS